MAEYEIWLLVAFVFWTVGRRHWPALPRGRGDRGSAHRRCCPQVIVVTLSTRDLNSGHGGEGAAQAFCCSYLSPAPPFFPHPCSLLAPPPWALQSQPRYKAAACLGFVFFFSSSATSVNAAAERRPASPLTFCHFSLKLSLDIQQRFDICHSLVCRPPIVFIKYGNRERK